MNPSLESRGCGLLDSTGVLLAMTGVSPILPVGEVHDDVALEGEVVSLSSDALPLVGVGLQFVDFFQVVTTLLSEI